MEGPDFIFVALTSLFRAELGFLSNLAWPDVILIFLVMLLLSGARKLPELFEGMERALREMREMLKGVFPAREQYEPTEQEERILRKWDAVAVGLLVFIIAGIVVEVFQSF
jgi:Sec-independent protein translocase protein TatA